MKKLIKLDMDKIRKWQLKVIYTYISSMRRLNMYTSKSLNMFSSIIALRCNSALIHHCNWNKLFFPAVFNVVFILFSEVGYICKLVISPKIPLKTKQDTHDLIHTSLVVVICLLLVEVSKNTGKPKLKPRN
jgi:hypothetical protein